jgi:hypothetical protein
LERSDRKISIVKNLLILNATFNALAQPPVWSGSGKNVGCSPWLGDSIKVIVSKEVRAEL